MYGPLFDVRPLALFAALAAVPSLSCTHAGGGGAAEGTASSAPEDPSAVVAEARARGVVIATLQTHDKKVQLLGRSTQIASGTADPEDLRVVVRTNEGALLADGVTVAELERVDAALHALVTGALASKGTYLDATLHHDPAEGVERVGPHGGGGLGLFAPSR